MHRHLILFTIKIMRDDNCTPFHAPYKVSGIPYDPSQDEENKLEALSQN